MVFEKKTLVSNISSIESNVFSELENIIKKKEIPNALLFTGWESSFLTKSANNFAKTVNCLHPLEESFFKIPCNQCRSCKKIMSECHPDIIHISPENQIIKISTIRNIFQFIVSKPNEAKKRVIIIENAETMNEQAQNAFLKILEEPPSDTFFILTTENVNSMLATIISRCRNIGFNSIDKKIYTHEIIKEKSDSDIDWIKRKKWLLKEIGFIVGNTIQDRFSELKPLLLAEKLSNETNLLKNSLSIISTFIRDMVVVRYHPDKIINKDCLKILKSLSNKISLLQNLYFFKKLYEVEKKNQSNPSSIRLNLECFFLKISVGGS